MNCCFFLLFFSCSCTKLFPIAFYFLLFLRPCCFLLSSLFLVHAAMLFPLVFLSMRPCRFLLPSCSCGRVVSSCLLVHARQVINSPAVSYLLLIIYFIIHGYSGNDKTNTHYQSSKEITGHDKNFTHLSLRKSFQNVFGICRLLPPGHIIIFPGTSGLMNLNWRARQHATD